MEGAGEGARPLEGPCLGTPRAGVAFPVGLELEEVVNL
jgi:hypothetical protein